MLFFFKDFVEVVFRYHTFVYTGEMILNFDERILSSWLVQPPTVDMI